MYRGPNSIIRAATILLLLACLGRVARAQETIVTGRWVGGFSIEGEWTLLVVGFDDQGGGGYLVRDDFLSALTTVQLDASNVHFETATLSFDGELAGEAVSGRVVQGEERGDFYLMRLAEVTTDVYDAYIGNYQSDQGPLMLVARSDGAESLFYQRSGRQVTLFPSTEGGFLSALGEEITFVRGADAQVAGLTIRPVLAPGTERFMRRVELVREEEVRFSGGDVVLAGTLLVPPGEGPHPTVLLIHGAGAAERQYYRVFADHFARHSIAALIYDKRGSGNSTGDQQAATLDDLAADARAGVRFLVAHPEVNPAQVGVWGISQGARVAPMVAARSQDVSFVIGVSALGISWNHLELWRRDRQYRDGGYPEWAIEMGLKYGKLSQDWEHLLGKRNSPDDDLTPTVFWTQVGQPTCLLYGAEDMVVPPDESAAAIASALCEAGNQDHTIVMFPGADHNLFVGTPEGPSLAPGLMETMSAWILERAADPTSFGKDRVVRVVPEPDATGEFDATGRYGSRPWYGGAVAQSLLTALFAFVFLSACVRWPLGYLWRRWLGRETTGPGRPTRATFLAGLVSCLNLILLAGFWVLVLTMVAPDDTHGISSYRVPPLLLALPWPAWIATLLTLGLPFSVLRMWQKDSQSSIRRVHTLLVTLVAFSFVWFMSYWHLLGF